MHWLLRQLEAFLTSITPQDVEHYNQAISNETVQRVCVPLVGVQAKICGSTINEEQIVTVISWVTF